eukprot:TRINITY_DN9461_c0_g2_i1.p1 TRINITY_DN9461_c0_g2~~TRINITY_DN9461_c0_g2_i1.p1  ORF type:complete len:823 (+),score=103.53 TRINITY_DN9461_c0_g2_i1:253-2469(+)
MMGNFRGPPASVSTPTPPPGPTHHPTQSIYDQLETLQTHPSGVPALQTILKILQNICRSPSEGKYRSIKKHNQQFQATVGVVDEAVAVLKDAGFTETAEAYVHSGNVATQFIEAVQDALEVATAIQSSLREEDEVGQEVPADETLEAGEEYFCKGIGSYEEIVGFDGGDVKNGFLLPRDGGNVRFSKTGPRILICHDMQGNYTKSDKSPYGCHTDDADSLWRVRQWGLCDVFAYFAHTLLAIPPIGWINACHTNGAKCLASLVIEHQSGATALSKILASEDSMTATACKLVEIQNAFKFDGYFLNVEVNVPGVLVPRLVEFLNVLKEISSGLVIWYDSVVFTGHVKYQNGLNEANKIFFDASHGIFTNYWYNEETAKQSLETAGHSRKHDVWKGVDVFGRRTYGGGGFQTHKAVELSAKYGLSTAVFAPGWSWEHNQGSREKFEEADDKLWCAVKDVYEGSLTCTITRLPFTTTFNTGCGKGFSSAGMECNASPWFDLSATSVIPPLPLPSTTGLKSALSPHGGWDGSSCLTVDFSEGGAYGIGKLFDCDFQAIPPQGLSIMMVTRNADIGLLAETTQGRVIFHPSLKGEPGSLPMLNKFCTVRVASPNAWVTSIWKVTPSEGVSDVKSISLICVKKEGSPNVGQIGRFSITTGDFQTPSTAALTNVRPSHKVPPSRTVLHWNADDTIVCTDIWSQGGKTWLGRSYCRSFILPEGVPCKGLLLRGTDHTGQATKDVTL